MSASVLVIAGMHRSGTSLVAHYLHQCGLNIGNNLFNPQISSPERSCSGHHEDLDFIDFHKQVFKRHKIDSSALLIKGNELPIVVNEGERSAAMKLLEDRALWSQWGWKDPRTTLFLNFWHELIESAYYLLPFRHPLLVVDSLVRRGNEKAISRKPIIGLRIWTLYNQQILSFAKRHPDLSLLCNIEDFITEPEKFLIRLNAVGMELPSARLEDILSQKAFHNQSSEQVQKMAARYPQEIAEANDLFQQLQSLSQDVA